MNKLLATLSLALCTTAALANNHINKVMPMKANVTSATVKTLKGDVKFETVKEGLQVTADLTGLIPNSTHGFHIHEKGLCDGPDYKSAGDHFNPEGGKHGAAHSKMSHVGDLGNIEADKNGNAHLVRVIPHTNADSLTKIAGKAVIVHEKTDDLKTQPSGDSGDRIGCGIIQKI